MLERFWSKVAVGPDHWLWTAALFADGYGRFWTGRAYSAAHRVAYELTYGPIPQALQLDHLCRVRPCVRPDHLEAVTCRVNLLRGETLTAREAALTHCLRGHPFDEVNTYLYRGTRQCRACRREALRRHKEAYGRERWNERKREQAAQSRVR